MAPMGFAEEDVKVLDQFGAFLQKHARFDLGIDELLDFHRQLVKYNTVRNKIEAHIFEVRKLHKAPEPVPAPAPEEKPRGKK